MLLYFLGTGAGKPSPLRNVSSLALRLPEPDRELWLFDCGEGTQHQLLTSPFTLRKIRRIFITHLHGDHIFGLPGLLASRSFSAKDQKLSVYGPPGLKKFLDTSLGLSATRLSYPLKIYELEPEGVFQIDSWVIRINLMEHGLPCYGYRLEEKDRPGRLDASRLERLNVPFGPIYGRLKRGETVVLEDGRILHGGDFVGPRGRGRHVVIMGDTRYSESSVHFSRGADVLVHEATFAKRLEERAFEFYHSTTLQAAQIAKEAEVKMLILTHFSSRYKPGAYGRLLEEAQGVFPNTYLAEDHFSMKIAREK